MSDASRTEPALELGPPRDAEDDRMLALAQGSAFGLSPEEVGRWWESTGREPIRVARVDHGVVGGLLVLECGQFLGGRRVTMAGYVGVAVLPEHRGRGHARAMMRASLAEMRERGVAVATLRASNYDLYRRAGFEHAGTLHRLHCPFEMLPRARHSLRIRRVVRGDHAELKALYRDSAVNRHGCVDRERYLWNRVRTPFGKAAAGFLVEEDGRCAAYAWIAQQRDSGGEMSTELTDWLATSATSAAALFGFVRGHATLSPEFSALVSPHDPLLLSLQDRRFRLQVQDVWMLRVLDVERALNERGWPKGQHGEIGLCVEDPDFASNSGAWNLKVSDGHGHARRVSDPSPDAAAKDRPADSDAPAPLKLGVRALAPLFTGHISATHLRAAGRLEGTDAAVATADALFRSPTPAMVDAF